jgi:hypothetical protein
MDVDIKRQMLFLGNLPNLTQVEIRTNTESQIFSKSVFFPQTKLSLSVV